jgi:hypothetical protein
MASLTLWQKHSIWFVSKVWQKKTVATVWFAATNVWEISWQLFGLRPKVQQRNKIHGHYGK